MTGRDRAVEPSERPMRSAGATLPFQRGPRTPRAARLAAARGRLRTRSQVPGRLPFGNPSALRLEREGSSAASEWQLLAHQYPYVSLMLEQLPRQRMPASVRRLKSGRRILRFQRGTRTRRGASVPGGLALIRLGVFLLRPFLPKGGCLWCS